MTRYPRVIRMAEIVGLIFFSTWAGMAYARGDYGWYVALCGAASLIASLVYFNKLPQA